MRSGIARCVAEAAKVKICGLTRMRDIEIVNACRPEYAGFVFVESRRRLLPETARELIGELSASIIPVGVFVDASPMEVAKIALQCRLGVVQLHGAEDASHLEHLRILLPPGVAVWKAFRIRNEASLLPMAEFPADRFLLDAWHPELAGGTGDMFDWRLLLKARAPGYMLAGGLTPGNVADAIRLAHPWGVDVSSGVETDGLKDSAKVTAFVESVRFMLVK
jgi:phosphoribosylanthranilate isomerase